jgi:hypothetical protein
VKSLDQQARAILDDAHPTYPYDGSKGTLYSVGFERAHSNIMAALMNRDEQIRVLREALEWYADEENWQYDACDSGPAERDEGEAARIALAATEPKP